MTGSTETDSFDGGKTLKPLSARTCGFETHALRCRRTKRDVKGRQLVLRIQPSIRHGRSCHSITFHDLRKWRGPLKTVRVHPLVGPPLLPLSTLRVRTDARLFSLRCGHPRSAQ